MRLGELEGIVGEEDGYEGRADRSACRASISTSCTSARCPSSKAARRSACCSPRRSSETPTPSSSTSPPTTSISIQFTGSRTFSLVTTARSSPWHLARPILPQLGLHAHCRHRLRDDHHLHRWLRRHGAAEDPGPRPHRITERAARQEDRTAQRVHRALLRRHAQLAGELPQEGSRASADD